MLKRWAVALCRANEELEVRPLVGSVADRIATALATPSPADVDGAEKAAFPAADPPGGWANPWLLGVVHEQAASAADRRARGAWYTPRSVVDGLVQAATSDLVETDLRLFVDPTCGGGAFLLAALDRLVALGVDPNDAVGRIAGMDLDPTAVEVARWSIQLWLAEKLGTGSESSVAQGIDIRCGNALSAFPESWRSKVIVVGNPPFASPLKSGTIDEAATAFRSDRAEVLGPYADLASIHLVHVLESVGPGSTVALVQPQSILSSRDTEGLRSSLERTAPLHGLWAAREALFDAGVRACCPILRVGEEPAASVRLYHGSTVEDRGRRRPQGWGALAADALGAPRLPTFGRGRLGALVGATAGFRDEHYALVAACREADEAEAGGSVGPGVGRVFTVGSVDPLTASWGRAAFRFGGQTWVSPVVDRDELPPRVQRWFDRLQRPKVLLATQAKLLEPYVDRVGTVVPATPLVAVTAEPDDLDRVAAVLLAPPVVLWAWRRWFGTAMSVDALKLAAKQVGDLPLPVDDGLWQEAARLVGACDGADPVTAADCSLEVAEVMTRAYGAGPEVYDWWVSRRKSLPVAD